MRIAHTSDSHIDSDHHGWINPATGRKTSVESNLHALATVVNDALTHRADVFIHAGDAFANERPSAETLTLFASTLAPLVANGVPVVLIDGNHERQRVPDGQSSATDVAAALLRQQHRNAEVHLATSPSVLTTSNGLSVVALPWLTKNDLSDDSAVEQAYLRHADRLFTQPLASHVVLAGHFTVIGGRQASEQDMTTRFTEPTVTSAALERYPYAYGALGHLHAPQQVGQRTFYAGSPNRFTMNDAGHAKTFNLVDLTEHGAQVRALPTAARLMVKVDLEANGVATLESLPPGAIVEVTLPAGVDTLPRGISRLMKDRGLWISRQVRRPASVPANLPKVNIIGEQTTELDALRQHLADRSPSDIERIVALASTLQPSPARKVA